MKEVEKMAAFRQAYARKTDASVRSEMMVCQSFLKMSQKIYNISTVKAVLLSYVMYEMLFHGAFDNEPPAA